MTRLPPWLRTPEALVVAVLTLAAAALRFPTLGAQSYWIDEALTVQLVRASWGDAVRQVLETEANPPLYYLLARVWSALVGTGEFALRSLSALVGTATVPLVYGAGVALGTRRGALVAAALVAVSPLLVWYAQEARPYALVAFLGSASLLFFARALREPARPALAGWAAASVAAVWTHYFALFLVAAEGAWLLAVHRRAVLKAVVAAAAGCAAAAPLALYQAGDERAVSIAEIPLGVRVKEVLGQFLAGEYYFARRSLVAGGVFLVVALLLVLARRRPEARIAVLAFALAAAVVATPLALDVAGIHFFAYRNLIVAWIPLALGVGALLAAQTRAVAMIAAAVATAALAAANVAVFIDESVHRDDWRGVDRALGPPRLGRLTVLYPWWHRIAFDLYRTDVRRLDGNVVYVREIDLVGFELPPPTFRPRGFRSVETRDMGGHGLTFMRFVAPRTRRVRLADVVTDIGRHPQKRNGVLLDEPPMLATPVAEP